MGKAITDLLKNHQSQFRPVVEFDPANDRLTALDLTINNEQLPLSITSTTDKFSYALDEMRRKSQSRYMIGGYNELRQMYSRSELFNQDVISGGEPDSYEEPRRLHLGTDIWGEVGTEIFCPYDATVHSTAFNDNFGDYGATIILAHKVGGKAIHSLYGHLSLPDIEDLAVGAIIKAGECFAHFGPPAENGEWPPHLHFQLIVDMQGMVGDYPGVCKVSEKEFYLANCPDPDIVLQMNQYIRDQHL